MSFLLTPARRTTLLSTPSRRAFSTTRPTHLARMTLVGRFGADPELVDRPGLSIVRHVLGTSHGTKDNPQTSWFRITSFVNEAQESRKNFLMGLEKGTLVYLEGDATMKTFTDREGKQQSALNIVQTKIDVLKRPRPKEGEEGAAAVDESGSASATGI